MVTLMAVLGAISFGLWLVALVVLVVVYRKMGGPALLGDSHNVDIAALKAQQAATTPNP